MEVLKFSTFHKGQIVSLHGPTIPSVSLHMVLPSPSAVGVVHSELGSDETENDCDYISVQHIDLYSLYTTIHLLVNVAA